MILRPALLPADAKYVSVAPTGGLSGISGFNGSSFQLGSLAHIVLAQSGAQACSLRGWPRALVVGWAPSTGGGLHVQGQMHLRECISALVFCRFALG